MSYFIPWNLPGWFQFLPPGGAPVKPLRSIQDVLNRKVERFLLQKELTGFRYVKGSRPKQGYYSRVQLARGEVLSTRYVCVEAWPGEGFGCLAGCLARRLGRKLSAVHGGHCCYLQCSDAGKREVLLPCDTKGIFYEVRDAMAGKFSANVCYQLRDLVHLIQLPVPVRLVYGDAPKAGARFTGLLQLESVQWDGSVGNHGTAATKVLHAASLSRANTQQYGVGSVHRDKDRFPSDKEPDTTSNSRDLPAVPKGTRSKLRKLSTKKKKKHKPTPHQETHPQAESGESDYEVIPYFFKSLDSLDNDMSGPQASAPASLSGFNPESVNDGTPILEPHYQNTLELTETAVPLEHEQDGDGYLLPSALRTLTDERMSQHDGSDVYQRTLPRSCTGRITTSCTEEQEIALDMQPLGVEVASRGIPMDNLMPMRRGQLNGEQTGDATHRLSGASYDAERLDAFLADSVNRLNRSSRSKTASLDRHCERKRRSRRKKVEICTISDNIFKSQEDLHKYLDVIFDEVEVGEVEAEVTGSGSVTDQEDPGDSEQSRDLDYSRVVRSMSVPETMVQKARQRHNTDNIICGTVDSGIWVSPRSTASDPYQQEKDSNPYRSASELSWMPPADVSEMSVEEVGMSLRYIGLKETLVQLFLDQQIDGKQLNDLDQQLLKEGFPDLNALERKKVLDFVHHSWRPKKINPVYAWDP